MTRAFAQKKIVALVTSGTDVGKRWIFIYIWSFPGFCLGFWGAIALP